MNGQSVDLKQVVALGELLTRWERRMDVLPVGEVGEQVRRVTDVPRLAGSRVHIVLGDFRYKFFDVLLDFTERSAFVSAKETRRTWSRLQKRLRTALAADRRLLTIPETVEMVVSDTEKDEVTAHYSEGAVELRRFEE